MTISKGYWTGMATGMKWRFLALVVYLAVALVVLTQNPILGTVLLLLPIIWSVFLLWLGGEAGLAFGPFSGRKDTVLGYTARYLWGASAIARVVLSLIGAGVIVGGLGWISTENMRAEAAKPTMTERASTLAETATEATKGTASGWIETAKGWFTSEGATE